MVQTVCGRILSDLPFRDAISKTRILTASILQHSFGPQAYSDCSTRAKSGRWQEHCLDMALAGSAKTVEANSRCPTASHSMNQADSEEGWRKN